MAVDDIDLFRARLPDVFEDAPFPPGFEDEWMVISIESPEGEVGEEEALLLGEQAGAAKSDAESVVDLRPPQLPALLTNAAGGPVHDWSSPYPPPDAMAFYMPFHYYHPRWWGVYLSYEGTADLVRILLTLSRSRLPPELALHVARVFLYAHEAYHHSVESFATRLEVTHRRPLYRLGFEEHYQRHLGTDLSVEEALANAYALRKVATVLVAKRYKKATRALVRKALLDYIKGCPPGYRLAGKFENAKHFTLKQREFAEDNHHVAVGTPRGSDEMWSVFPQAFTGISRVTSRVNYIVHRSSPLVTRLGLNLRYIPRRRILQVLESQGCVHAGGGAHDKWKTPTGASIPVPRHTEIAIGTARSILERAGLRGSLDAMLRG